MIKQDVEFTSTKGEVEKVNLRILPVLLQSKAIKLRRELLKEMDAEDAKPGSEEYELAKYASTIFYAAIKSDGSPYFESKEDMQARVMDTTFRRLFNVYTLHKQENDADTIYAVSDDTFSELINDVKEGGEGYISPFWLALPLRLQYLCFLTTVNLYLNCLEDKFSSIIPLSSTESNITPNGSVSPSEQT